jgi:hypothetical protein
LATLSCCGPSTAPLGVEIRDAATRAPVAGATVIADVPSRNHPLSVATLLGQTGPKSSRAVTDADGRAGVAYVPDRPVRLTVVPAGGVPESLLWDAPGDAWRAMGPLEVRAR